MLSISTLGEALDTLSEETGRRWTESEFFDFTTHRQMMLNAAVPITIGTTKFHFDEGGRGLIPTMRMPGGHKPLAILFAFQVGQLWLTGRTQTKHPVGWEHGPAEWEWYEEPVPVTRNDVRVRAETLREILKVWSRYEAGEEPEHRLPQWMRSAQARPAISDSNTAAMKPAFPPLSSGQIALVFDGIAADVDQWMKRLNDPSPWLLNQRVEEGKKGHGGRQATWAPLGIAEQLVTNTRVTRTAHERRLNLEKLNQRFLKEELLAPHRDHWRIHLYPFLL